MEQLKQITSENITAEPILQKSWMNITSKPGLKKIFGKQRAQACEKQIFKIRYRKTVRSAYYVWNITHAGASARFRNEPLTLLRGANGCLCAPIAASQPYHPTMSCFWKCQYCLKKIIVLSSVSQSGRTNVGEIVGLLFHDRSTLAFL